MRKMEERLPPTSTFDKSGGNVDIVPVANSTCTALLAVLSPQQYSVALHCCYSITSPESSF